MGKLLDIAADAAARRRDKREEREESPRPPADATPFPPFPPFYPSPPPLWNSGAAIRAMHDADTLVAAAGVSGQHAEVQTAADAVVGAYRACDTQALTLAITAFTGTVRRLAECAQV